MDGEHHTGTEAEGAFVDVGVTCVDVGHEEADGTEEQVGVAVVVLAVAVFSLLVADREALPTGAETDPLLEILTEIDVNGRTGTLIGEGAVLIVMLFAVKADIDAASGSDEPFGVPFLLGAQ